MAKTKSDKTVGSTVGSVDSVVTKVNAPVQSIAGLAKENIFEFPVFVSNSVTLDYATATNSLLEQVYASYLQMAISINPIVDSNTITNGTQFAAFKTNTNKYLEYTTMEYAHEACHNVIQEDGNSVEFSMLTLPDKCIDFINEYCNHEPLSEFNHFFQEADDDDRKRKKDTRDEEKHEWDREANARSIKKDTRDAKRFEFDKKAEQRSHDKNERDKAKHKMDKEANQRATERHLYDTKTTAPKMLDEGKIQKLNTLKPLLMNVSLKVKANDGHISDPVDYIVGVKTFCRIIDADILPEVAKYPMQEMNKLSRKAKWHAGEIKFFEYLFKIKEKKQSAIDAKDKKRKWYRRLYELAHSTNDSVSSLIKTQGKIRLRDLNKAKTTGGLIPNATIIMSQSDVDNIKNQTDIDLLKASTATSFCKELFLMSLVVIDTDKESIKIMTPDLHNDYEIHSIASVTKQLSVLDSTGVTTKEISKLFGK